MPRKPKNEASEETAPPPEGEVIVPPEGEVTAPPPEGEVIVPPEGEVTAPPEAQVTKETLVTVEVLAAACGEADGTFLRGQTFQTTPARAAALGDSVRVIG